MLSKKIYRILLLLVVMASLFACKKLQKERTIYKNDFEGNDTTNINNGKIEPYNGSNVLGRYSEAGFLLQLKGIGSHNMIRISFDLYIHDTWDGNITGADGRDIWIMNIDGWSAIYSSFANGDCVNCTQSYPELHPTFFNNTFNFALNKPNSNAIRTDLPGACKLKDVKGGTSMYHIQQTFNHTGSTLDVGCFGQLEDPDAANKNCNESWSVDNIKITAIEFR